VDLPAGACSVSVFDEWQDLVHPFAFVSRPVQPAGTSPIHQKNQTTLFHEFVPAAPVQSAVVRFLTLDDEGVFTRDCA
jgi:hypothetical protein